MNSAAIILEVQPSFKFVVDGRPGQIEAFTLYLHDLAAQLAALQAS